MLLRRPCIHRENEWVRPMKKIDNLPEAYARYREAGGVLEFTAFEVDEASEATVAKAIEDAIRGVNGTTDSLLSLRSNLIDRQSLLGQ